MLDHASAVTAARAVAERTRLPQAAKNDASGTFSEEAIAALGEAGLLGLTVPAAFGGSGLGPRTFAEVSSALAEADPSVAMIYMMHVCGVACLAAGASRSGGARAALEAAAAGKHLSTLAFSEKGSRSHFWAPVSRAVRTGTGVELSALKSWVTSAGHADSYIVSAQSPDAKGPTDTALYLVLKGQAGMNVAGAWDAMGMRSNAASPMSLEASKIPSDHMLIAEGEGFKAMLEVVLPLFCLGSAAVSLGICRAAVASTAGHLKSARFEHLGTSLGEALPNLRANLATMQIDTDGLAARLTDLVGHLEAPGELTVLRVLESKASAGDVGISVTQLAMRTCGGAAFSRHTGLERYFRDAQASAVMAPTGDVLREFIGKALLGIPLF